MVARWHHLSWEYWCQLDEAQQAGYIAAYETIMRFENLELQERERERALEQHRQRARAMRPRRR